MSKYVSEDRNFSRNFILNYPNVYVLPKSTPVTVYKSTSLEEKACNITEKTNIKICGSQELSNGDVVGKVYIPADGEIIPKSFYGYIKIGSSNSMNVKITQDMNKAYLQNKNVTYTDDPSGESNINTTLTSSDRKIRLDAIEVVEELTSASSSEDTSTSNIQESSEEGNEEEVDVDTSTSELTEEDLADFEAYYGEEWVNIANSSRMTLNDYESTLDSVNLSKLRGVFGMPYQFLPTTDCRIDGSNNEESFGITYAEMIASRLPLLYITPGNPSFLADMGAESMSEKKTGFISNFISNMVGDSSALDNLINDYSGKLYSIEPAYAEYFKYVNPMCRIGAIYLDLGWDAGNGTAEDEAYYNLDGVKITNYNWAFNDNSDYTGGFNGTDEGEEGSDNDVFASLSANATEFQKWIYYKAAIPFYINSDTQFTDTFANETTESALASTINGFSDKARELQFLLGVTTNTIAANFDNLSDVLAESKTAIDNLTKNIASGGNLFSSLINNVKTVVSGGRLQFPNIWANSTFGKSYSVNIKLTTPDLDRKSWFLNIYVPLCHLIALCLPRGEFHNGYSAPFIIKAFYKGMFNIDMGIISNMTVQKGKEGGWTRDGLPTVVEVSMDLQDLYTTLSMSPSGSLLKANVLQNIGEMDYLANLCGVNINVPDTVRMMELYVTLNIENVFIDIPGNIVTGLQNKITNRLSNLFSFY